MKMKLWILGAALAFQTGCVLSPMQCLLAFSETHKTYYFNCSKEELKNRIVQSYSYDESSFLKILGKTVIYDERVDARYRRRTDMWLDKSNWDQYKPEIRNRMPDTLDINIEKHLNRKKIELVAIISGDAQTSTLTIERFKFRQRRACDKDQAYYQAKLEKRIARKFIRKI